MSAQAAPFGFLDANNLDTPDDGEVAAAAAGGAGVAGQVATTVAPISPDDGADSSSSSSEEDMGSDGSVDGSVDGGVGAGTTAAIAGPLAGPGREAAAAGAAGNGGSSQGNDAVVPAVGGPIIDKNTLAQAAGAGSGAEAQQLLSDALNSQTDGKESQSRQSGALVAMTVLGLVCGIAGLTIAAHRNRAVIRSSYSRLSAIH